MKRLGRIPVSRLGQICLLGLVLGACAVPSGAQPAMSRGEQMLRITPTECLNRAVQALRNVGFSASAAGDFAQGVKDISGAYIMCNDAPGGATWVNIVVSSSTEDPAIPGNLRQLLQVQMQQPGPSPGTGTTPSDQSLVGTWAVKCCNEELAWTMYIKQFNGSAFTGTFSSEHGGGDINGQVRGSAIEFDRTGTWGKQHWSGQIVTDGGKLRIINGIWTGDSLDAYRNRNDWHAEKQ